MIKAFSLAILLVAVANVASAGQDNGNGFINTVITDVCKDYPNIVFCKDVDSKWPAPAVTAPEIDAASAMAGMTILLAGLAVVRGRRAKKSKE
jgi:hypothetical protein